ncbi:DegT/DnrJ/EryC1/StrS family aminotransferase [Streptomyces ureilyticus]|uniref:DegT/DnrJ/EryC1/StrS aminotransferase family protein n=1 Tax=Streptomyces ureilyticus TaxID=1775131 RepID=A0ABX0DPJ6_9ACTN|nr:DegT/DnrJ/EryC1/StrS aminotransferase family protein [Streptomyces ureilyticus]NGO41102.1 DegT/DnrJ/EryC1/StrS aminotransferase family protein [Streptomyces ureilyticus]
MTVHKLRPRQRPADRGRLPASDSASRVEARTPEPVGEGVPFAVTRISPEARRAADRVLASGWVTTGPETERFEHDFAEHVSASHAVAVSSCTAGLELALRALRLPAGGRVLVPAVTFCGAAHAVLHAGLRPVLVDVDPRTGMPTPATVARAARASGCPHAMMVMHYAGSPAPLAELAEAAHLPLTHVIEDAAHAVGTTVGDQPVGSLSRATCFSFYATKNLPIGEGGMVTTDDAELAGLIRRGRLHGMSADAWRRLPGGSWRYTVEEAGLKANMTDVQAAVGRAQLRHLEDWQRRRQALAERYEAALGTVPGLARLEPAAAGVHARHLCVVRVLREYGTDRDELIERLAERGIGTSVHFIPLHHMPYFQRAALIPAGGLPGADTLFPQLLSLPLYPHLRERALDRVCGELARLGARRPAPRTRRRTGLRMPATGGAAPGQALARDPAPTPQAGLDVVGVPHDDPAQRRDGVNGALPAFGRLVGTWADVSAFGLLVGSRADVSAHRVEAVVVAGPGPVADCFRRMARAAEAEGAGSRHQPSFIAALLRDMRSGAMRSMDARALRRLQLELHGEAPHTDDGVISDGTVLPMTVEEAIDLLLEMERNDTADVRRVLAELLAGFPTFPLARQMHARLADPHLDDF